MALTSTTPGNPARPFAQPNLHVCPTPFDFLSRARCLRAFALPTSAPKDHAVPLRPSQPCNSSYLSQKQRGLLVSLRGVPPTHTPDISRDSPACPPLPVSGAWHRSPSGLAWTLSWLPTASIRCCERWLLRLTPWGSLTHKSRPGQRTNVPASELLLRTVPLPAAPRSRLLVQQTPIGSSKPSSNVPAPLRSPQATPSPPGSFHPGAVQGPCLQSSTGLDAGQDLAT